MLAVFTAPAENNLFRHYYFILKGFLLLVYLIYYLYKRWKPVMFDTDFFETYWLFLESTHLLGFQSLSVFILVFIPFLLIIDNLDQVLTSMGDFYT